jgi:hypothetical protein
MFSESKTMDVYLSSSSQNIGLSTSLFSPVLSKEFNSNSVDVVKLFVHKADDYLLKTVILESSQIFSLVVRLISDVLYINCTEFEKLRFWSFAAL